jgi:organic hydroperoxide reductase OsmC/OhrA
MTQTQWHYRTGTVWTGGTQGRLEAGGKPALQVGTPPEFGGQPGVWTPEDLLAASVGSCLLASLLFFVQRAGVTMEACRCDSTALMEKGPQGLVITRVTVDCSVTLADAQQEEALRRACSRAEASCPVSRSLACPVHLTLHVQHRQAEQGGQADRDAHTKHGE